MTGETNTSNGMKKLRPLVITMGGERQSHITEIFSHPALSSHFHPPTFSPGIPSRSIRNRKQLLHTCYRANLLTDEEWHAIENHLPVPIIASSDRQGRKMDLEVPYSVELWRKAKSLNRGRSVFACLLAHLIAMRMSVEDENGGYDVILEDNVRPIIAQNDDSHDNEEQFSECATRIRDTIKASINSDEPCLLRYYGWLGSIENVQYVYRHHAMSDGKISSYANDMKTSVFSFPTKAHDGKKGTSIWGAFAYWISPEAYHKALIPALRSDVGSMLWKGKRMRAYLVKPIDKVLPRKIIEYIATTRQSTIEGDQSVDIKQTNDEENEHANYKDLDAKSIHVTTHPSFYRAPMLTSTIHKQWDVEFCKSTEVQFEMQSEWNNKENKTTNNLEKSMSWENLWLTEEEKESVKKRYEYGSWDAVESSNKHIDKSVEENGNTPRGSW